MFGQAGKSLTAALLKSQLEIEAAGKDGVNDYHKKKDGSSHHYATVESVIDAVKPVLNKHGIVFLQAPAPLGPDRLGLVTYLIHAESGEYIEGTCEMPLLKPDPQGFGSAMTYARRYCLASFVGLKTEDDDAETAMGRGAYVDRTPRPRPAGLTPKGPVPATPAAEEQAAAPVSPASSRLKKVGAFPVKATEESNVKKA